MLRLLIIFLIGSLPYLSIAQKYTLSEEVPLSNFLTYDALGFFNQQFLSIRGKTSTIEVQAYDANLQKTWDKKIRLSHKNPSFLEVTRFDTSFYVFFKCRYKRRNEIRFHKYNGHAILIDSASIFRAERNVFLNKFETIFSKNGSKIMIYEQKQSGKMKLVTFDLKSGQKMYEKVFEVDQFKSKTDNLEFLLDNSGNSYILHNKNNTYYKKENHQLILYKINKSGLTIDHFELKNHVYETHKYIYDEKNDQILMIGIVPSKRKRPHKIVYIKIKGNHLDLVKPIDLGHLAMLKSSKEKKEKRIMSDLSISDIIVRLDGGLLVFLEKKYEFNTSRITDNRFVNNPNENNSQNIQYFYEDILVFNINPDGSLLWKNRLEKRQSSENDFGIFSSGYLKPTKKSLKYYYNDAIKIDTKVFSYNIKPNGEIKRSLEYNTLNKKILLRWKDAIQLSKNQIIVPSQYRKELRFLLIDFNK